ncbi:hypothetical protein [Xylella fastidiosa]|uniref:hypothetical protein n=1 Tax=Xylella fastidiosa TaxID=2371 RepID=UPI0039854582
MGTTTQTLTDWEEGGQRSKRRNENDPHSDRALQKVMGGRDRRSGAHWRAQR